MEKNQSDDIAQYKFLKNEEDDKEYWDWIENHKGYVMKDKVNMKDGVYIYHKSDYCTHMADRTRNDDGTLKFSHKGVRIICAINVAGIEAWFKENKSINEKIRACKTCRRKDNDMPLYLNTPIITTEKAENSPELILIEANPAKRIKKAKVNGLPEMVKSDSSDLDKIDVKLKTGKEQLTFRDEPLNFSLLDFWQWSVSDIISNATRGLLAEFIVATATNVNIAKPRKEWAAYDLDTPEGIKLEIKSAAYLQTWFQKKHSPISFGIKATRSYDYESNKSANIASRDADVYVFCLLNHKDKPTVNPLDMNQWEFYVLATKELNEYKRSQHSITLKSLQAKTDSVSYYKLYDRVKRKYFRKLTTEEMALPGGEKFINVQLEEFLDREDTGKTLTIAQVRKKMEKRYSKE